MLRHTVEAGEPLRTILVLAKLQSNRLDDATEICKLLAIHDDSQGRASGCLPGPGAVRMREAWHPRETVEDQWSQYRRAVLARSSPLESVHRIAGHREGDRVRGRARR